MNDAPAVPLITTIAAHSRLANHQWVARGTAPIGYVKGMAVAFARAYCKLKLGHPAALDMAKPDQGNSERDALAHLRGLFVGQGMDNSRGGADVLRHLFVLLYGLGMRESSGQYSVGQDKDGGNTSASTVETGLFQVSYNSIGTSFLLGRLFREYDGSTDFLDIFKEGVSAKAADLKNWGGGAGAEFQRLSKACPAFAAEYGAVVLRENRQYSGPINRKTIEIARECDDLFRLVQSVIDQGGHRMV